MSNSSIEKFYLESFWDWKLPVNPEKIAKKIGLEISYIEDENISGGLIKDNDRKPTILINKNEPDERRRFAAAHELGHYLLNHPGDHIDLPENFNLYQGNNMEFQANLFAIDFLTPDFAVDLLITKKKIKSINLLAKNFGVSENLMRYRLKSLGAI